MSDTNLIYDQLDLDASHYVKHSSLQNNLANTILNGYSLSLDACVLDVGCGDGRVTAELAKQVTLGTVIGLDASSSMIEFASKNFPKAKFPNLDFQLGMAENAVFSQKFDFIVSFSCFHWLKDPQKVIQQLSSYLKEKGEMLILTYPKESPYYQYLQEALKNYPDYSHLSSNNTMLSAAEYKRIFIENELEILDFQQENLLALYNNEAEIRKYIQGWLNSYVYLPEELHNSFLDDVIHSINNDSTTRLGEQIGLPYTALIMKVKKPAIS